MDWGQLAAIGSFFIMAGAVVYSNGRTNGKLDSHADETRRRFDTQDKILERQDVTLTGLQVTVGRIKTKLDMNGHG